MPFPVPSGLPCALGLETPRSLLTAVGRGHEATCTPSSACSFIWLLLQKLLLGAHAPEVVLV